MKIILDDGREFEVGQEIEVKRHDCIREKNDNDLHIGLVVWSPIGDCAYRTAADQPWQKFEVEE